MAFLLLHNYTDFIKKWKTLIIFDLPEPFSPYIKLNLFSDCMLLVKSISTFLKDL